MHLPDVPVEPENLQSMFLSPYSVQVSWNKPQEESSRPSSYLMNVYLGDVVNEVKLCESEVFANAKRICDESSLYTYSSWACSDVF